MGTQAGPAAPFDAATGRSHRFVAHPTNLAVEVSRLLPAGASGERLELQLSSLEGARVRAFFDDSTQPVSLSPQGGRHVAPIPSTARTVRVVVSHRDFHEVDQTYALQLGPSPTIARTGHGHHVNTVELRVENDGPTLVARVVALTVRSVFDNPTLVARMQARGDDDRDPTLYGVNFGAAAGPVWEWKRLWVTHGPALLGDLTRTGPDRLRQGQHLIQHRGRILLLELKLESPPQLLAVFMPHNIDFGRSERGVGMSVFLHPHVPASDSASDSFAREYVERAYYYLVEGDALGHPEYQMNLAQRHWYARKKAVVVVPIGRRGADLGGILSKGVMMRTLAELGFWLQRRFGIAPADALARGVDRVAVSCFSASVDFAKTLLNVSGDEPPFDGPFDRFHRELYCFDPNDSDDSRSTFASWFDADRARRRLRVYTSRRTWGPAFARQLSGRMELATFTNPDAPDVHHECGEAPPGEDASWTVAFLPEPFWEGIVERADFTHTHHEFPRRFITHALRLSGFEDG